MWIERARLWNVGHALSTSYPIRSALHKAPAIGPEVHELIAVKKSGNSSTHLKLHNCAVAHSPASDPSHEPGRTDIIELFQSKVAHGCPT